MRALELSGVVKRYRKRVALDGLSLTIPQGCVMGLVGSNGAGKTTMLSAIAGLIRIQEGEINILNSGPFDSRIHAGRVSLIPQDAQMPGHLRIDQFLRYLALLQGVPKEDVNRQIDEILDQVNLADRKRSKIHSLSHGMRRRVTIAQAFIGSPELILLDEPLNGLDPREVANIRSLIKKKSPTQSLLVSSHLLNEVEEGCDEIAFIEKGRCVRQDRLDQIISHNDVVKVWLADEAPPVEAIQKALPADDVAWDSTRKELKVSSSSGNIAELNTRLLRVLLNLNLSVLEVKRGHGLEEEYLRSQE